MREGVPTDSPGPHTGGLADRSFHREWEDRVGELRSSPDAARADYEAGVKAADYSRAHATVDESVGLIRDLPGAAELVARISSEARQILEH
jgi:nitronate monooxygenase